MINKVFGIGLSKTGTSSLSEALNMLGIKSIHYPDDIITFRELHGGRFKLSVLQKYQGITDTPVVPYYPQLDKEYPGSKFILTIREMSTWLASVKKHWETSPQFENQPTRKEFQSFIRTAVYGCVEFNEDRFRYIYNIHYQNALQYFKERPYDLLVLDICAGDGWEKLCSFLGTPVPEAPFPHANEWMHKLINATNEMKAIIPEGADCILIDEQTLGREFNSGRNFIPFPNDEGVYSGPPADDIAAIAELEKDLSNRKPEYIIVGWPSFWWFDIYPEFGNYIRNRFECVVENEDIVIFKINKSHYEQLN